MSPNRPFATQRESSDEPVGRSQQARPGVSCAGHPDRCGRGTAMTVHADQAAGLASGPPAVQPADRADSGLVVSIAACFLPVGLLVLAANGGGAVTVAIAFIVELATTATLVLLLIRAVERGESDAG